MADEEGEKAGRWPIQRHCRSTFGDRQAKRRRPPSLDVAELCECWDPLQCPAQPWPMVQNAVPQVIKYINCCVQLVEHVPWFRAGRSSMLEP